MMETSKVHVCHGYVLLNAMHHTGFEDMQWKVPVTIATGHNKQALTFLLETNSTTVTLDVEADDWIKVSS